MKCFVVCLIFASVINGYQLASPDVFQELPSKPRCHPPKLFSDKIEKLQGSGELPHAYKSVEFSLHHIIAYSKLRRFYNKVMERSRIAVENNEKSILDEVRMFFRTINETLYFNPVYKLLNYKYSEARPFFEFILMSPFKSLSDHQELAIREAQRNISCAFVWLPSNVFVGPSPQYRKDDPGAGFEYNAVVVVDQQQHEHLRNLQNIMEKYVNWDYRERITPEVVHKNMKMIKKYLYEVKIFRPSLDFKIEYWKQLDETTFELVKNYLKRKLDSKNFPADKKYRPKRWVSIIKHLL